MINKSRKIFISNPNRTQEHAADLLFAVATRSLNAVAAFAPSAIKFIHQGKAVNFDNTIMQIHNYTKYSSWKDTF